jgi:hypothetical protein
MRPPRRFVIAKRSETSPKLYLAACVPEYREIAWEVSPERARIYDFDDLEQAYALACKIRYYWRRESIIVEPKP